jgi:Kef-type K+ transport system membrane component KefB
MLDVIDVSLAGAGMSPLVQELGICLLAAALVSVAFEKVKIPTIAALLAAGVVIGPEATRLIENRDDIETIANLGLTLLLFVIGLEVNLKSLLASGRTLIVTGIVQVPLSVVLGLGVFMALRMVGLTALDGRYVPLYLGLACGFSSTLLVIKLLQERLRLDTVAGRLCLGLLIFQDIWAIVVLALQPSFDEPSLTPIALTFGGIALLIAVAYLFSRFVLPAAFRIVADVPELVVLLALGWCFGLGLFGEHMSSVLVMVGIEAEMSVSLEMGALIAGTSIATFPYHYEVVGKVIGLRDFFVTLFFVGLGMGIPRPESAMVLALAAILAVVALFVRYLIFLPLLYFTGLARPHALETSTKLAQISEFCLVIVYLGQKQGHIEGRHTSIVIFAFVLTALATPWLFSLSETLDDRIGGLLARLGMRAPDSKHDHDLETDRKRLVMLGFHRTASALLTELSRNKPELAKATLVVDTNLAIHDGIRALGAKVVYGDLSNQETLRLARLDQAELVLITVPDELLQRTSNETLVRAARAINPEAIVFATASKAADVPTLEKAGATYVFVPPIETSLAVLPALFAALNGDLDGFVEAREREHGSVALREEPLS